MKNRKRSKAHRSILLLEPDERCLIKDLPNELFWLIFQECNTSTLLSAASACRKLNTVAILFFLDQIGFKDQSIVLGGCAGVPFSALRGLRIAFSVRSINSMRCNFSMVCAEELREVKRWLDRLTTVKKVHLSFPPSAGGPVPSQTPVLETLYTIGLKRCSDLHVSGVVYSNDQDYVDFATRKRFTTLAAASIGVTSFFSPPLLHWTTSSLECSTNLRTLDLKNLQQHDFTALTSLSLCALRTLRISFSAVSFADLVAFFDIHQKLKTVSLIGVRTYVTLAQSKLSECPPKLLPKLKTLTSSFTNDIVYELLMNSETSLPKLQSVSLTQNGTPNDLAVADHLKHCFDMISQRSHITKLSLVLVHKHTIISWLQMRRQTRHTRYKDKRRLSNIVDLSVECTERAVVDLLPPWLALFPRLKKFTVRGFTAWNDEEDMVEFVRLAKKSCKELVVVSLSPELSKSVDEWLV